MILADTTVWIDLFAGADKPHVSKLTRAIEDGEDLCVCGIMMTEILQGIRKDKDFEKTQGILNDLICLPASRETYIEAARIYRACRKKGVTIRKPVGCIIAAVCMEHAASLLHNDRDFDNIVKQFPLQMH